MNFQFIKYEIANKVAWLKFNRPDQLNAMNRKMMEEIIDALNLISEADSSVVRVAVITGEGKAFMAGADIKEYARQSREEFENFQTKGRKLYASIEKSPKPIIAALNGYAFGGGLEIALACDMILAAQGVKMGLPEIHLNLIPGGGGTQRLPRKIGVNLANEMIMTGKTVTAEDMYRYGLVNQVFPTDTFIAEINQFAQKLAVKEPDRLRAIKMLIHKSAGPVNQEALESEFLALSRFYMSDEGQDKVQEFIRKSQEKK